MSLSNRRSSSVQSQVYRNNNKRHFAEDLLVDFVFSKKKRITDDDIRKTLFCLKYLPVNLLQYLFQFLTEKQLYLVSQVCVEWNEVASLDSMWERFCVTHTGYQWNHKLPTERWKDCYHRTNVLGELRLTDASQEARKNRKGLQGFVNFNLQQAPSNYQSLEKEFKDSVKKDGDSYTIKYEGSGIDLSHPELEDFRKLMLIEDLCLYCLSRDTLSVIYLNFDEKAGKSVSMSLEASCGHCGTFSLFKYPEPAGLCDVSPPKEIWN